MKTELHAFLVLTGGVLSLYFGHLIPLLIFGSMAFLLMSWRHVKEMRGSDTSFGVANTITLGRLCLLILTSLLYQFIDPVLFGIAMLVVIIADGLDGYYARKLNEESDYGAAFDMETDAFLAAVLTILIYTQMEVGIWLLVAGFLRYIFVITRRACGWHEVTSPHMPGAKLLAVLFFVSLILPFFFSWEITKWSLIIGAMLIYFSFGREFLLIAREKLFNGSQ